MIESKIYHKIDWLTFVVEGASIMDFFDIFDFSIAPDLAAAYASAFIANAGYQDVVTINACGFHIEVPTHSLWPVFHSDDVHGIAPEDFLCALLPKYRVDLSGSTLDDLRSTGVDVDSFFRKELPLAHGEAHCTRCDFAFDLVNYAPAFLDDFIQEIRDYNFAGTDEVPRLYAGYGAMKFSVHLGDRKTVYMGGTSNSRLLRIYDKRFERARANKLYGCEYSDEDGTPPDSWIRLELQLRRDQAGALLYADSEDPMEIFRYIYDHYAVRKGKGHESPILDCWASLFDWGRLPPIVQNKNVIPFVGSFERSEKYVFNIAFNSIINLIGNRGPVEFLQALSDYFVSMQTSNNPFDRRRFLGILQNLYRSFELNGTELPPHIRRDEKGIYRIE